MQTTRPPYKILVYGFSCKVEDRKHHQRCSLGRIWLISSGLSANEQYFSFTPNQSAVLSAMAYKPIQPKRTSC